MRELISRVADGFGQLRSVAATSEFLTSPSSNGRFDEYVFRFESGQFVVTANPSDDTILLNDQGLTLPNVVELSTEEPWHKLLGCGVLWIWLLENHRGYLDGIQIEFAQPGRCWCIQLMCEASSLSARSVGEIGDLTNQFI